MSRDYKPFYYQFHVGGELKTFKFAAREEAERQAISVADYFGVRVPEVKWAFDVKRFAITAENIVGAAMADNVRLFNTNWARDFGSRQSLVQLPMKHHGPDLLETESSIQLLRQQLIDATIELYKSEGLLYVQSAELTCDNFNLTLLTKTVSGDQIRVGPGPINGCHGCRWRAINTDLEPYCIHPKTLELRPFGSDLSRDDEARSHCGPLFQAHEWVGNPECPACRDGGPYFVDENECCAQCGKG